MTDLLVLGLTPVVTAVLLAGFAAMLLMGEWLLGVAQRTRWSWFGHPWTKGRAPLSREGSGGALRLRGSVDGHAAAAAVAFPAGGRPHFHLGAPRKPRTMIQLRPRVPLPDGLDVQRGGGGSEEDSVGPARVRTQAPEQTRQLLADPSVRQALVSLVHDGEDAGIRDGVLLRRHAGVLDADAIDAQLQQLGEIASALSRPAEDAWARLGTDLGMGLGAGDTAGERTAIGRIQGGLSVRIRVQRDESSGQWRTQIRVGLAPGAPRGVTLAVAGEDVPHTLPLAPEHALAGRVSCGAEDADALAARLERPDVCAGIEELILGWPDTRVGSGHIEARIPGWSWHDLQDRVLSMGVLAWLLAGEIPERIPRR
jgi:hypothetical protein